MSLAQVPDCGCVRILGVKPGNPMSCRLMEMGFVAGSFVQVLRRAPFGGPLHLRVGDSQLSLRLADADLVDVAHD